MVKNFGPWGTQRVICCLTMPGHKEAMVHRWGTRGTHGSWQPIRAWWARKPSRTRWSKRSGLSFLARGTIKPRDTWRSRQAHGACHTLLSFWTWWSLESFETRRTLRTWEPWFSFDDIVGTWGPRGTLETFRSGYALISLISLHSLQARKTFLTLESWNARRSHISL